MQFFDEKELGWLKGLDLTITNNENIDVDYEERVLEEVKMILKMYNREVFNKTIATAEVCQYLGGALDILEVQFYLASHYANFGFLGLPGIIGKKDFLNHEEKKILHLHPMYGMEFMRQRNLNIAAYLVYMHHELPNGKGYHREQKLANDAAYLIHIADSYVGLLSHKTFRPAFSKRAAIDIVLQPYEHYEVFKDEMSLIRGALNKVDLDMLGL